MATDEPFTIRTVVATTGISTVFLLIVLIAGIGMVAAWVTASVLNVILFAIVGVGLQIRSRLRSAAQHHGKAG